MRILAADPGETTGYVLARWSPAHSRVDIVEAGQGDFDTFVDNANRYFHSFGGAGLTVVAERFTITAQTLKKTRQTTAIEVIGALRWLCHAYNSVPVSLQSPSDAKNLVIDRRLKELGWWVPGQDHCRDALRHLGLFLTRNGWDGLPT